MSKSLGNSPDPLDLIEKYGADGLRFGIISIAPQGQDIRFQEDRIEGGKNFCNKLWNASRFRQMSGPAGDNSSLKAILSRLDSSKFDADDHGILQRLIDTMAELERCFRDYEFSTAVQALYSFFWGDFCDWYVEVSKSKLQNEATKAGCLALQDLILRQTLQLLHPYTPYITEELWMQLGYAPAGAEGSHFLMRDARLETVAEFKEALKAAGVLVDRSSAESVEKLKKFVSQARALKAEHNQASKRDSKLLITASDSDWAVVNANLAKLIRMCSAASLERRASVDGAPAIVTPLGTLYLDLASSVDAGAEKIRIGKELEKLAQHISATEARLSNPAFTGKAPPAVIDGAKKQLAEQKAKHTELERLLAALG
jgi:valyl-tRNA synthetase